MSLRKTFEIEVGHDDNLDSRYFYVVSTDSSVEIPTELQGQFYHRGELMRRMSLLERSNKIDTVISTKK